MFDFLEKKLITHIIQNIFKNMMGEEKNAIRRERPYPSSVDQRGPTGQIVGLLITTHKQISIILLEN
jgi:hypothetical protein